MKKVIPVELMRQGGKWLGAARTWIQWHCVNGEQVIWGSHDELKPTLTVKDVEELAADVAAAAINEYINKLEAEEKRKNK